MAGKPGSDIPAAELEVISILWRRGSATARDVLDDLAADGRQLAYTTVLTLMGRLERRGYAAANRGSQPHVYRPLISREKVTAGRLEPLIKGTRSGEAVPLILRLVKAHRLSAEDIRQLRQMLSKLEKDAGGAKD